MYKINLERPAFCLTLPVNTSRYSGVYKNYIKDGKWEEVETSSPFYSMAVEEYLACKQAGIECEIKSIPRPTTERGKKNLKMILNRLGAEESDLFTLEIEDKLANIDQDKIKVAKKEFEETLKDPITQEEREMGDIVSQIVAANDSEAMNELKTVAKLLNMPVSDLFVAAIRAGELGCTHGEAVAMYSLCKKYTNLASIADIFKAYILDGDSDEIMAIISQTHIDIFNAMIKDEAAIGTDDIKFAKKIFNKDLYDRLKHKFDNEPIIVDATEAAEQQAATATEQPDQPRIEQKVDQNATEQPVNQSDQYKKNEQKRPDQNKQPEQEKEPAVQVDGNSAPGEKPIQAGPVEPDRINGFVNHNLPTINKYAGCIDVVNFAASLGYSTKLTEREDGLITAEVFAVGVADPISKLVIDPGVLYPNATIGYALLIPDGGTAASPSYSNIVMADYIYLQDTTEYGTIATMISGQNISKEKRKEIKDFCSDGKRINCVIDHSSIPTGITAKQQYILGEFADKLFAKGIKIRGAITESSDTEMKIKFTSNAGKLQRYYQNKKYGNFTATVNLNADDSVSISVLGDKKSARLQKILADN